MLSGCCSVYHLLLYLQSVWKLCSLSLWVSEWSIKINLAQLLEKSCNQFEASLSVSNAVETFSSSFSLKATETKCDLFANRTAFASCTKSSDFLTYHDCPIQTCCRTLPFRSLMKPAPDFLVLTNSIGPPTRCWASKYSL